MWLLILLTWVEYFLSSAVTRTERAVDLEVVGVIQEGSTQGEQHSLKSQHNYIIISKHIHSSNISHLHPPPTLYQYLRGIIISHPL